MTKNKIKYKSLQQDSRTRLQHIYLLLSEGSKLQKLHLKIFKERCSILGNIVILDLKKRRKRAGGA